MRRIFSLTIIVLMLPLAVYAQETQTLFTADVKHGGFGAIQYGVTSINDEAAYLRGSRGAWVIRFGNGNALNVGIGSYRTANEFEPVSANNDQFDLSTNYGGFELEFAHRSTRLFHVGAQTTIGSGTVRIRNSEVELDKTSDRYFVFQPGVNANLNVTRWFRISGGAMYRFASGVNLEGTSDSDLSGASAVVALRFGKF